MATHSKTRRAVQRLRRLTRRRREAELRKTRQSGTENRNGSTEGLAGRHVPRRGGDPPRDPGAGQELIGSTSANRSDLRSIPRRITGKTPRDATSPQAIPMVRSTPRLKIPRWLAIIRLPKPTMVWIPLSATAMTVLRATSGPPWERPSRYRSIMLSPNSAEVPMMSGRPQMLARFESDAEGPS